MNLNGKLSKNIDFMTIKQLEFVVTRRKYPDVFEEFKSTAERRKE